jgi:hypothetical protein
LQTSQESGELCPTIIVHWRCLCRKSVLVDGRPVCAGNFETGSKGALSFPIQAVFQIRHESQVLLLDRVQPSFQGPHLDKIPDDGGNNSR